MSTFKFWFLRLYLNPTLDIEQDESQLQVISLCCPTSPEFSCPHYTHNAI